MIRTKHLFVIVVAFIVFLVWIFVLIISVEAPASGQVTETVIMGEPRDFYSVEYDARDDGYMRRAIFIEKVRNTLLTNPMKQPVVEEEVIEPIEVFSSTATSLPAY